MDGLDFPEEYARPIEELIIGKASSGDDPTLLRGEVFFETPLRKEEKDFLQEVINLVKPHLGAYKILNSVKACKVKKSLKGRVKLNPPI